jgi:hypothetical protein
MDNLLAAGVEFVQRSLRQAGGGPIVVTQNGQTVTIPDAIFARATQLADDPRGDATVMVEYSELDVIVRAEAWAFGGVPAEPVDGARIVVMAPGPNYGQTYEAMPMQGKRCYRYCDPRGALLRVHTKQVMQ